MKNKTNPGVQDLHILAMCKLFLLYRNMYFAHAGKMCCWS